MKVPYLLLFLFAFTETDAQDTLKHYKAVRISQAPRIDGVPGDDVWKDIVPVTEFIQNFPKVGEAPTHPSEVRIAYDNVALYVCAVMYDSSPDSILKELGERDNNGLNADYFRFVIDPYNTRQDAYDFGVFASGVQTDYKFSDNTYNAVWESAAKINDKGWCVEMKIPYSAIRFPKKKIQEWALQLTRTVRRTREFDQYSFVPQGVANAQRYWHTLDGIENIDPPTRLSLTPYLSAYAESAPEYNTDGTYTLGNSFLYKGGADLKYGLDERFTLDMTLLPDFGQVQSDNKVKNLSYRETTYEENRPFFKEGTELFNKNRIFYSRRIGKTPSLFYDAPYLLGPNEILEENPSQVKLLNATKLSGRTNNGTGIGILNAVTDNAFAVAKDEVTGEKRKFLTEPLTNFNALVIEQQLKNASNIYFINTNVIRKDHTEKDVNGNNVKTYYGDDNVSGIGYTLNNKKSSWATDGTFALSQKFNRDTIPYNYNAVLGYSYFVGVRKISGNWQYGLGHEGLNKTYDRSGLGYQSIGDFQAYNLYANYNIYKPRKKLLQSFNGANIHYSNNYTTGKRTDVSSNLNLFFLMKSYWGIFGGGGINPYKCYDYYEPRVEGRYYINRKTYYAYAGFSTNYQKKVAIDLKGSMAQYLNEGLDGIWYEITFTPRIRFNDKFSMLINNVYAFDKYNEGFANFDENNNIVFGGRMLHTFDNKITAKYIFKNDMSLSLVARHYWSTGEYVKYFVLLEDGTLADHPNYSTNNNFSYNAFNIDLVYSWQFSPGSLLSVVYKNAIETQDNIILSRFDKNLSNTFDSPQTNSLSLKVLYYLDYQNLKRKKA